MQELLQQVRILDPASQTDRVGDVSIEDGVIAQIADAIADIPSDATVIEGYGLVLAPGLVDVYSHSGEPGFEERETLYSLRLAAAAGGFTRVAVLPTTHPPIDNPASVHWFFDRQKAGFGASAQPSGGRLRPEAQPEGRQEAEGRSDKGGKGDKGDRGAVSFSSSLSSSSPLSPLPSLFPWAALTTNTQGQQMTELAELALTGAVGFTDGQPIPNLLLVRRMLEYLHPLGKPVMLWACDRELVGNGVMREGPDSMVFGLPGIPAIAETTALAALLECVEETGTPVHFMRLSTARGVELIRSAKARGLPVTASTTWMHLLLNTQALSSYDPSLRLLAPLGSPADQQALVAAVQQGVIDAIAVDHAPFTYEDKTVALAESPPGAIGLELALPLLWQALVETNQWSALDLWSALSSRPACCLQQSPAVIKAGESAEMLLFDPQQMWIADARSLRSLSANTPWFGQSIQGRVAKIWC
ncbi:MAG: dihydroorotase [Oscillatoriales cyanobacterium C42_A2020_001]|nr:dihydroorotase [Leptolyngbyaceae cyanobacterium C42_A2020_001]